MYTTTVEELQQLIQNGRTARRFAIDHLEELAARKHTYTLYGPHAYFLGACVPCNTVVPKKARKLSPKTRRKNYVIYHLDEQFKVVRNIIMTDYTRVDVIYHHFELDGVTYAFETRGHMQDGEIYPKLRPGEASRDIYSDIHFLRYEHGKPVSYGSTISNAITRFVFVQFYEYTLPDQMLVSTYRYWPDAELSVYGYPVDPEAPIGALNSSVQQRIYEAPAEDTDFSRWFRLPE